MQKSGTGDLMLFALIRIAAGVCRAGTFVVAAVAGLNLYCRKVALFAVVKQAVLRVASYGSSVICRCRNIVCNTAGFHKCFAAGTVCGLCAFAADMDIAGSASSVKIKLAVVNRAVNCCFHNQHSFEILFHRVLLTVFEQNIYARIAFAINFSSVIQGFFIALDLSSRSHSHASLIIFERLPRLIFVFKYSLIG